MRGSFSSSASLPKKRPLLIPQHSQDKHCIGLNNGIYFAFEIGYCVHKQT